MSLNQINKFVYINCYALLFLNTGGAYDFKIGTAESEMVIRYHFILFFNLRIDITINQLELF